MINSFIDFSKWKTNKTKKQLLEDRIRNSVLNLIIERDQSFLRTARARKTNIIVNNREGGLQEFEADGDRYISFPDSLEDKLSEMLDIDAEEYMDNLLKLATTSLDFNEFKPTQDNIELFEETKRNRYKQITGEEIELSDYVYEARASTGDADKDSKEDEKDIKEGSPEDSISKITERGMSDKDDIYGNSEVEITNTRSEREYKFEDTELNPDSKFEINSENDNEFFSDYIAMTEHRENELKSLSKRIVKSFNGRISKLNTSNPSKKIRCKVLSTDTTEKIYQNKRGENGKHLKVNLIIDMSGSMNGKPVENAVEMIYIFNELALSKKLTGCVIWSESSNRAKSTFPMPRDFIKRMLNTGGSEGLGRNLKHYIKELREADENICMTDGQLCDDAILKSFYEKEKIRITGVYVNEDAKDLTEYTGSLDRWFTRSLVRRNMEELTEKLIQLGLRKKGC